MTWKVFVDGSAGTTGLRIVERLAARPEIELLPIGEAERKAVPARLERIAAADVSILCLPDSGAREIVEAVDQAGVEARLIDCSTAHRTARGWLYGLPEAYRGVFRDDPTRYEVWREATRVANPGCHATGFILAARPFADWDLGYWPSGHLVAFSLTGYSGGGKAMIAEYESPDRSPLLGAPRPYSLGEDHKHLAEIRRHGGYDPGWPIHFTPVVADFHSGLLVSVSLPDGFFEDTTLDKVSGRLREFYAGCPLVRVLDLATGTEGGYLSAGGLAGRDDVEVLAAGRFTGTGAPVVDIVARLDNLGKGAS
ncbi:MAG: N-acetyl-gamma-glutamyl-phosphate reductase, partial [Propionibacteriaceae bacterium]|nr:N-acetyl-gamma-glutamyl-phosphate reductase [Propionibacteriaceae bacterium]